MANANFFSPDGGITRYPLEDTEGRTTYEEEVHGINLLKLNLADIKAWNTAGTWNENAYTLDNTTYTFNSDKTVTVNSSAATTGISKIFLQRYDIPIEAGKRYILSGCPSGGSSTTFYLQAQLRKNGTNVYDGTDMGNGLEFPYYDNDNTDGNNCIAIIVRNGVTVSNQTFRPMLTEAQYAGIPYRPYNQQSIQHQINDINGITGVRNWLENKAISQTVNGITYTKDSNDIWTINGTATAHSQIVLNDNIVLKQGERFIVADGLKRTDTTSYGVRIGNASDAYMASTAYGEGIQDSFIADSKNTAKLYVANGITVNNVILKPMIKLASDPSDEYVPFAMTNRELTDAAGVWTSPVSRLTGDTTATVSNAAIHTTSTINPYIQTSSGATVPYSNLAVTEGQAVITFGSALTEAASVKLQILNV